ncbi:MAG TPA: hypothetical protein VOB72_08735 [Candidatus Dormibacteraeota bacterium]|nr:hypothetical protein [Candidatus Dormibacteraeota bacterium]
MGSNRPERSGTLVLRVWTEADAETPLRARMVEVSHFEGAERDVAVTATAVEVCALVCAWVEAFAAGG